MSTRVLDLAGVSEKARALPVDSDTPPSARTWLHGRLLELGDLPPLSRALFWLWCRVLHQPLPGFYDMRGTYGTRAEARTRCRDANDYVLALPYGRGLGSKVAESPTFCRPLWPPHARRDREHSELYPEDLSSHFSAVNLAAFRQLANEFRVQGELRAKLH